MDGFQASIHAGGLPFAEALEFFAQKTNVPTKTWRDIWEGAHARAFSVAGATSADLLQDFRDAIDKALQHGTTLEEFKKDFNAIVEQRGWKFRGTAGWRAQIIYETNLNMAFAAGRYKQMSEPTTLKIFPYWIYRHSGNPHPRLQHLAWDGLTLAADDSFWLSHYPPNGFHCGCSVEVAMREDLRRMGKTKPDPSPPVEMETKVLRDGTEVKTPTGVDPGFGYNVGKAWRAPLKGAKRSFVGEAVAAEAPLLKNKDANGIEYDLEDDGDL